MRSSDLALALTAIVLTSLVMPPISSAVSILTDQSQFEAAAGASLVRYSFEDIPVNASQYGAISNGQSLFGGRLAVNSLTFTAGDIMLHDSVGSTGLSGTSLIRPYGTQGNYASIGGIGDQGTDRDDDDFEVILSVPATAFGAWIVNSRPESGEFIAIYGANGEITRRNSLGGTTDGSGADAFVGFVLDQGEDWITRIVVEEANTLNDDIGIARISF